MVDQTNQSKAPKGIYVISLWLLATAVIVAYHLISFSADMVLSPKLTLSWSYVVIVVACALGLLFRSNAARSGILLLSVCYWVISVAALKYLGGPTFKHLALIIVDDLKGLAFLADYSNYITPSLVKKGIVGILMAQMIWPIIMFFYLSHPAVKDYFRTD